MRWPNTSHGEKPISSVAASGADGSGEDLALAVVGEHARPVDPILEAQVVRKIDTFLIPTMFIGRTWSQFGLSNQFS
jgi:hypothetical protein